MVLGRARVFAPGHDAELGCRLDAFRAGELLREHVGQRVDDVRGLLGDVLEQLDELQAVDAHALPEFRRAQPAVGLEDAADDGADGVGNRDRAAVGADEQSADRGGGPAGGARRVGNADRVTNRGVGDESRQPFRRQIADLAEADDDCAGRVRSRHGENLHRTGRARVDVEIQPAAEASAKSDVECRFRADDRVVAVVADGDGIFRLAQVAVQHGDRERIDERHRADRAGGGLDQLNRCDDFREGVFAAVQLLVRRPLDGGRSRRLAGEEVQADFDRV